jgi:predicted lipoprotein
MKKIQKFAMAFFISALALGFASCSSDDNEGKFELPSVGQATTAISSSDLEMQKVTKSYVQNVIYPTYQALAKNARDLYSTCTTLYKSAEAGTMTQSQINAACEAFKNARREWERSEAFLYGSASDNNIDPHIDSWPLDHDGLGSVLKDSKLIAGFKSENPEEFVSSNNEKFQSVLGFHGMEFVLFRNGQNRTVAALQANETEEGLTSVKGIDELAFLAAVAGDVKNMTALLEYTWMGDAASNETKSVLQNNSYVFNSLRNNGFAANGTMCFGQNLLTPTQNTGYISWPGTINQIFVGGCSNICNEVQEQKLGQAWRVAHGLGGTTEEGDAESINYIESPYSHRSFVDYKDNIYSIKNTLYGTRNVDATTPESNSIMALLHSLNYSGYSHLQNALTEALKSLDDATAAQGYFVANPGSDAVKNAIDKIKALDDELKAAGQWINQQNAK